MDGMLLQIMVAIGLFAGDAAQDQKPEISRAAKQAVERLEKIGGRAVEVDWNKETGTPGKLEGALTKPSKHSHEWIAYGFLEQVKGAYGLKRVREDVAVLDVDGSEPELVRVVMQRQLYGKPVCGDILTVEIDRAGVIVRAAGRFHAGLEEKRLNRPMYPSVTAKQAAVAASQYAGQALSDGAAEVQACYLPTREGIPLVYAVTLKDASGNQESVMVHSMTGRVIGKEQ
jgi:Zn-dependent metalloprotease